MMVPKINSTTFGSITVGDQKYEHDVTIHLDGSITKRKKKLSKKVYGTSHILSLDEAKSVYEKDSEMLIIGSGQSGMLKLSDDAKDYFESKNCLVEILPTPDAIKKWNETDVRAIGLFHVTC